MGIRGVASCSRVVYFRISVWISPSYSTMTSFILFFASEIVGILIWLTVGSTCVWASHFRGIDGSVVLNWWVEVWLKIWRHSWTWIGFLFFRCIFYKLSTSTIHIWLLCTVWIVVCHPFLSFSEIAKNQWKHRCYDWQVSWNDQECVVCDDILF